MSALEKLDAWIIGSEDNIGEGKIPKPLLRLIMSIALGTVVIDAILVAILSNTESRFVWSNGFHVWEYIFTIGGAALLGGTYRYSKYIVSDKIKWWIVGIPWLILPMLTTNIQSILDRKFKYGAYGETTQSLMLAVDAERIIIFVVFAVIFAIVLLKVTNTQGRVSTPSAKSDNLISQGDNNDILSNNEAVPTAAEMGNKSGVLKSVFTENKVATLIFIVLSISSLMDKDRAGMFLGWVVIMFPIAWFVGKITLGITEIKNEKYLDIIGVGLAIISLIGSVAGMLGLGVIPGIILLYCIYKKKDDLRKMFSQPGFGDGITFFILSLLTALSAGLCVSDRKSAADFSTFFISVILGFGSPFIFNRKNTSLAKPFLFFILTIGIVLAKSSLMASMRQNSSADGLASIDTLDASDSASAIDTAGVAVATANLADVDTGTLMDNISDSTPVIQPDTIDTTNTPISASNDLASMAAQANHSVTVTNFFGMDQLTIEPNGSGGYTLFDDAHQYVGTATQGAMGIDINMPDGTSQHITTGGDMLDNLMQYNGNIETMSDESIVMRDSQQQIVRTITPDGTILDNMMQVAGNVQKG